MACEKTDRATELAAIKAASTARGGAEIPAAWVSREVADTLLAGPGGSLSERQIALDRSARTAAGPQPDRVVRLRVSMGPPRPELETANVVGLSVGSDPVLREEYVVIGAHHDHLGRGEVGSLAPEMVGVVHPGADDNASGLAAMLILARQMAAHGDPAPRRSILFVAFGAEELGLRGSSVFLQECPVPRSSIVAMINLDMIGRATPDRLRVEGVGSGAGLADLVEAARAAVRCELRTRETATPRSDHWSFLRGGIPALFVHSGVHDQYHRPTDVACLVRVDEAVRVTQLVRELAFRLADAEARPRFQPAVVRSSFLRRRKSGK